jgi:hypothetical protein
MNYISCIIQILEMPTIESYSDNIKMGKFRIQLPYVRNKIQSATIINSHIWGNSVSDIGKYYRINDYVLVEGYLSTSCDTRYKERGITLNITKLYPFLFSLESSKLNQIK